MSRPARRPYAHALMFALAYAAIIGAVLFARPLGIAAGTGTAPAGIEQTAAR